MIFLKSPINGEQEGKKNSESELSFASNWRLKSGALGSRPRKQKSVNELRNAIRLTQKEELVPAGLSCSQEKSAVYARFLKVLLSSNSLVIVNMFESEESDSSVLRKSISEDDEWEKEEVHVEEVVLTSSTDREPAVCHDKILVLENSPTLMSRRWVHTGV